MVRTAFFLLFSAMLFHSFRINWPRIPLGPNHRATSRNIFLWRSVSPAAHEVNYRSPFIPPFTCALPPPVCEESRAPDCAVAKLDRFFQMISSYTFGRVTAVPLTLASVSVVRMQCAVGNLNRQLGISWPDRKQFRMRRVTASAVLALFIMTAPLCAQGQVSSYL